MPLLQIMQAHVLFAKGNSNIIAASKFLKNPIAQVIISFVLGYYATTKLGGIIANIRKHLDKAHNIAAEIPLQLDNCENGELMQEPETLRLTRQQLSAFNGKHSNQPIYTALNGNIYDLSSSRDTFLKPGPYSLLAGCNANQVLNITYGSMGVSTDDVLQRWEQSLNAEFNIIGFLIDSDNDDDDNDNDDN